MQGTQKKNNDTAAGDVLDLDALLAARSLRPKRVKLMGETYTVRRDLGSEQVVEYFKLVHQGKNLEALAMIVGGEDEAKRMNAALDPLPQEHINTVLNRIMRVAGLLRRDPADEQDDQAEQGESSAS